MAGAALLASSGTVSARVDQTATRPLAGTEDGQAPFFSPDGRWVGYWGRGRLWKVPVEGGLSTPLADVWLVGGVTWLTDDVIVIGRTPGAVGPPYDVMPDGRRLLMLEPIRPDDQNGQAVFVALGWMRELRQQLRPLR